MTVTRGPMQRCPILVYPVAQHWRERTKAIERYCHFQSTLPNEVRIETSQTSTFAFASNHC